MSAFRSKAEQIINKIPRRRSQWSSLTALGSRCVLQLRSTSDFPLRLIARRFLYARRDTGHWPLFFDLLNEGNKTWCHRAAALIVFISRTTHQETGRVLRTHSYDTGSAWMSLAYQGWMKGLVVHGMAGFNYDRAKTTLNVPDDFTVEAMAAVGRPGPKEDLPPQHLSREFPSQRHPVSDLVFAGPYRAG